MDRGTWRAIIHGVAKESDMTEQLSIHRIWVPYKFLARHQTVNCSKSALLPLGNRFLSLSLFFFSLQFSMFPLRQLIKIRKLPINQKFKKSFKVDVVCLLGYFPQRF